MDPPICDIIAEIHFYSENEGGRDIPTPDNFFGCPMIINGNFYDCRLLLGNIGSVKPGDKIIVPIKFLDSQKVLGLLKQDDKFELWEMRNIAEGKVVKVCNMF